MEELHTIEVVTSRIDGAAVDVWIMLPCQQEPRYEDPEAGIKRLSRAVFLDALNRISRNYQNLKVSNKLRLGAAQDMRWLLDDRDDMPFSASYICEFVGLDIRVFRQAIQRAVMRHQHVRFRLKHGITRRGKVSERRHYISRGERRRRALALA